MSDKLTEQRAAKLLEERAVPENSKVKGPPAFVFHGEMDTTKQPLRQIKPFHLLVLNMPPGLSGMDSQVLRRLFRCFAKSGQVSEGLIGDILFGFRETTLEEPGLPENYALLGLDQLRSLGYLDFQAKDGSWIDMSSDHIGSAWVRYKPKLLEMVYEKISVVG
jgi:hypothetical protein